MYEEEYSPQLIKKLKRLKLKDNVQHLLVLNKIHEIRNNPLHRYKNLKYSMKDYKRIHLGHFVLVFIIDHRERVVLFEDYDHHDSIYKKK